MYFPAKDIPHYPPRNISIEFTKCFPVSLANHFSSVHTIDYLFYADIKAIGIIIQIVSENIFLHPDALKKVNWFIRIFIVV
jgi:hypothetical protein